MRKDAQILKDWLRDLESEPTNGEQYVAHWRATCASLATVAAVKNQLGAERQLRKNCNLNEDQLEEATRVREARIAELGSAILHRLLH